VRTIPSDRWLRLVAILLLALAVVSLLAVAERTFSAFWQWYKFFGYEAAGVITLSKRTGIGFVVASASVMLACIFVGRVSDTRGALASARLSKWALLIFCMSLALYCAIALSPLNVWRP
jgi:hypothetical protein